MQVNTNKWGQSDTWTVAPILTPNSSTTDDANLFYYHGIFNSLGDYVDNNIFEYGTAIDDTICYSAHAAAEKMPLADIEYIDYTGNPVGDQTNNAGWFLSYKTSSAANLPYYDAYVLISQMGGTTIQGELSRCYRWCPAGLAEDTTHNPRPTNYHQVLAPIVQFSPRSAFYVIMVELITLDHKTRTEITLKELKDNFATYAGTHYISRAYMKPYTYRGRNVNTPTQFNDYAAFGSRYFGASLNNSVSFYNGDVISYYQTVGRGGSLPIIGVSYTEKLDSTHYGTRVFKRQSSGVNEYYVPVYSRNKVSTISTIHYGTANENYMAYVETDVYIGVVEDIIRGAAAYGLFFTDDTYNDIISDTTNEQRWINENMYLGVLDENGVGHGEYTKGIYNITNPIFDYDTSQDSNYNPKKDIDPNTYSNTTGFNYITEGAAMTVRYVLDGANVDKLLSDLWTINASIAQGGDFEYFDGKIKDEYLTTNPIDCIVSLIRYPFNIPYQIQPLQSFVKLGKTEGSAKGWTTVYISNQINFQGIDIFPRFGDCFLDYEPYTTYELYVPFCGTTKIRAADILGHTLNVTMLIDLITGSCTAYVKADQLVIETLQGSCGVQQQISGTDTATMNANIYNGILAQKQAKAGMIAQGASALLPSNWVNPVGYAAKGQQAETSYKQATFAIEHIETPVHSQGAASPLLGWIQEFDARLMIYYPEGDVIDGTIPPSFKPAPLAAFGHLKGFATVTPGTVGAFRSSNAAFISGDIIADAIPCTLSERNRIKSMFADGVYLPPL